MAPATATHNAQRLDRIEEEFVTLRNTMAEDITTAVSKSAIEMQNTITNQILASLEASTKRLEDRISRSRENQEGMIEKMRSDQQ